MQQSFFWDFSFCLFYDIKTGIPVSGVQYRKRRAAHPVYQEQLDHTDLEIEDEGEFIASVLSEISLIKGELMSLIIIMRKAAPRQFLKSCMEVMKVVFANRDFWTLMTCLPCAMSFLKNVRIFTGVAEEI